MSIIKNIWFKRVSILIFMFILTIIISSTIIFKPVIAMGGDIKFHSARIQGLSNYLMRPVNYLNFGGQGKMINVFYPPVTLLFTNIITLFTKNWNHVWKLVWLVINFINIWIAYFVGFRVTKNRFHALIFCILWAFSVERINKQVFSLALSNVYANAFILLVLYGLYEIFVAKSNRWYYLTIGFVLMFYTHIMTSVLCIYFTGIIIVVLAIFREVKFAEIKKLAFAGLWSGILSLFIFVPMIEQFMAYDLDTVSVLKLVPIDWLDFIKMNFGNYALLGWVGCVALIILLVNFRKLVNYQIAILIACLVFLIISTPISPISLLVKLPLFKNIQNFQRLFSFINCGVLFAFMLYIPKLWKYILGLNVNKNTLMVLSFIVVFGISFVGFYKGATYLYNFKINEIKNAKENVNSIKYNKFRKKKTKLAPLFPKGQESSYLNYIQMDYVNKGWNLDDITRKKLGPQAAVKRDIWKTTYNLNSRIIVPELKMTSDDVNIRFYNWRSNSTLSTILTLYKGVKVLVNNKEVKPFISKYKTLAVKINKKGFNNVRVYSSYTLLARLSQLFSVIGWVCFIIMINFNKLKSRFKS